MKARSSLTLFVLAETLVLLAVVTPVAHMRSLLMRVLVSNPEYLPEMGDDEPLFILARSLLAVMVLQVTFGLRDLYRWNVIVRPQLVVVRLIESVIAVLVALPLLHYVMGLADHAFGMGGALLRLQVHPFLIVAASGAAFLTANYMRMRWPRWIHATGLAERVAFVGRGPMTDLIVEEVRRRPDPGIEIVGLIDDRAPDGLHLPFLGNQADTKLIAAKMLIGRLVLSDDVTLDNDTYLGLRMAGARITNVSSFYERLTGRVSPASFANAELFSSGSNPSFVYVAGQRLLDVLCASLGLLIFLPFGLLVALLIKLESPGPIFYTQERMGLNGRGFQLAKFRSMRADAEKASGPVWAQANDARITKVGRWLRKLRIDEVPQLWAVLRNDMSLVGPRPERPFFVAELEQEILHYARRHVVKPGVTGWAQINYSYGNTTDDAFIKLQFDLFYVKHRTLALDISILLRTVKVVVLQQGAV